MFEDMAMKYKDVTMKKYSDRIAFSYYSLKHTHLFVVANT